MDHELQAFKEVSQKAIDKLQQPLNNRTNINLLSSPKANSYTTTRVKWSNASRADFDTGDFDKEASEA